MLIRWATYGDLSAWRALEHEVAPIFIIPSETDENRKKEMIEDNEILVAVDYMGGDRLGFVGLSRMKN